MKIIAFSLWGNNPKYIIGAIKNAELARKIYPGWVTRFYCGGSVSIDACIDILRAVDPHCCSFESIDKQFDTWSSGDGLTELIHYKEPGDWRGMFWRFQAASDPDCEAMISRDCDSRLSQREKAAVDEWLASPKQWHIMRDHPWHGALMLGGMWGVKGCPAMQDWIASWNAEDRYQTDQDFLRTMVYPIASKDAMIHAQFCAVEADAIPFPSLRSGLEFVGQVFEADGTTIAEHQNMLLKALKMQGERIRDLPDYLKKALQ